jgi:predicted transcriptional regulator
VQVVLDTNILVSALLVESSLPAQLITHWRKGRFTLLTAAPQLEELMRVTRYPKIRARLKPALAGRLISWPTSTLTLRGGIMNTVVLEVRSLAETLADASRAMKTGDAEGEVRISFATPELLWQVLTAKRWELLKALCGAGPVSIREAARRVGRDVKAVHGDVTALLNAGVLSRTSNGRIEFLFQAVKVEFMLRAA